MKRIADIPEADRPREKLRRRGAQALSDEELLAVLVGQGTQGYDVLAVAARLLDVLGKASERPSLDDLQRIKGVGPAKAMLISAALEFARRRIRPEGLKIS